MRSLDVSKFVAFGIELCGLAWIFLGLFSMIIFHDYLRGVLNLFTGFSVTFMSIMMANTIMVEEKTINEANKQRENYEVLSAAYAKTLNEFMPTLISSQEKQIEEIEKRAVPPPIIPPKVSSPLSHIEIT